MTNYDNGRYLGPSTTLLIVRLRNNVLSLVYQAERNKNWCHG